MVRGAAILCLSLASASGAYGQARLQPGEAIPAAELEAFVDGVVHQAMRAAHIAGAAVSVVQAGDVVLSKGYGFADVAARRRADDRTLFRIGSITKTFTWIALLKAVAAGRIALDDPVNVHLPPDLRIADAGFSEPIRIRHLMTHSAGFEDRMFGHLFVTDSARIRPLATYLRDERPRRVREPGRLSSYSNYGVALAGAALEQLSGRDWQTIVESDILEPLRMRHSTTREPYGARDGLPPPMSGVAGSLSTGYRWTGLAHAPHGFEYLTQLAPAGAISTSAADMARYMLMLLGNGSLDGVQVFGPETAAALRQPMTSLPARVGNWTSGFLEAPVPGGFRGMGHDGGSLLFFSSMVLVPELGLGIFVTTNTAGGDALSGPLPGRIVERFYGPPSAPRRGSPDPIAQAAVYEGYYLQTRRAYTGLQGFLFRLLARRVRVDSDGHLVVGLMGPPQRFAPAAGDEFSAVDPTDLLQSVLVRRDGAIAARIDTPFMAFERVGRLRQPPALAVPAVAAVILSLGTLSRSRRRFRRDVSRTRIERAAAAMLTVASVAWLISAASFGWFATEAANDESTLFYAWPSPALLIFSTAALAASVSAAAMVLLLPGIWRSAAGGWTSVRRAGYTTVAMTFAALGALLAWWGALQPWNP